MTRVLVTGGSGFIGTNLVEHWVRAGAQVMSFDRRPPRNPPHRAHWSAGDLLDRDALARAIGQFEPQLVFHLAARTDLGGRSIADYRDNTEGLANLVETLRGVKSLELAVFGSSMLVCRGGYQPLHEQDYCPSTAYGESKVFGEKLVRDRVAGAFPWVIVRPTSIWGPWFATPYRDFFVAVRRGVYVHPRGVRVRRSYGFVLNSAFQLARLAAERGGPLLGRSIYLADYEPIDVKLWADLIRTYDGNPPVKEVPLWLLRGAARAGDFLQRLGMSAAPMSTFRLGNMLTEMVLDTSPLQSLAGTVPCSTGEGVQLTCQWLDGQGH